MPEPSAQRRFAVASALCLLAAPGLRAQDASEETQGPGPVYRKMFVTSSHGSGDLASWAENTTPPSGLTGLPAGDKICQVRAEAAGLAIAGSPVFRAWLSTATTDAWCHIQGLTGKRFAGTPCDGGPQTGGGPWVRTDGEVFSGPLAELAGEGAIHPPDRTETGAPVSAFYTSPWVGTGSSGTATAGTCAGWTSGLVADGTDIGRTYNVGQWTSSGNVQCNGDRAIYCFEEGAGPAPPRPAVAGALAFVTLKSGPGNLADAAWQPESGGQSGLVGADAVCQASAAAATLPFASSFVAWLSSSAANAAARLAGDGPWKTLDGWPIASSKADLTDGSIVTAVRRTQTGGNAAYSYYWTGSTQSGTYAGTLDSTCGDWTSAAGGIFGRMGAAGEYDRFWTTDYGGICSLGIRLLCMSDVVLLGWDNFETGGFARWSGSLGAP